jgi:catechol 2,3-dioxygenase-like lactoylglutathione lyase family enzyme
MKEIDRSRVRFEGSRPILRVQDMQASLRFWLGLLGFQYVNRGTGDFTECVARSGRPVPLPGRPRSRKGLDLDPVRGCGASRNTRKDAGGLTIAAGGRNLRLEDFLAEGREHQFDAQQSRAVVLVDDRIDFDDFERSHGF